MLKYSFLHNKSNGTCSTDQVLFSDDIQFIIYWVTRFNTFCTQPTAKKAKKAKKSEEKMDHPIDKQNKKVTYSLLVATKNKDEHS